MPAITKALVVGVGASRGLGAALCRRFAAAGRHVLIAGTTPARIEAVAAEITAAGGRATAVPADATREGDVIALFDHAMGDNDTGAADLVVFNAGNNRQIDALSITAAEFESFWRVGCFGGFLVGREAVRRMLPAGRGTLIFTGASASLRGRPGFAHFAVAKAGLRVFAQALAREFNPRGIHVAHVVIDGAIDGDRIHRLRPDIAQARGVDGLLDIDAIAETYWQIHCQPRSAWSFEVELRPYKEPF
jgi:NAD(P)-dependent dehydrogenase (short-subunit alcohol dehydrogenase family)